jgi:hypothetical protein
MRALPFNVCICFRIWWGLMSAFYGWASHNKNKKISCLYPRVPQLPGQSVAKPFGKEPLAAGLEGQPNEGRIVRGQRVWVWKKPLALRTLQKHFLPFLPNNIIDRQFLSDILRCQFGPLFNVKNRVGFLSPIHSRFSHSIKDWQSRQMWLLCQ